MTKQNTDLSELEERLAESQAQIEALQTAAADAEARALTAQEALAQREERTSVLESALVDAEAVRDSTQSELTELKSELTGARAQLREAAVRYRAARLTASPEVPQELVQASESLDEIDREFEAAQRVVSQLRDKMEEEKREAGKAARVPAGAPPRRAPDLSALSAAEKIKLGLQQISERGDR